MTIEKLPSGKYRIKQMSEGTVYRVTVDHRPTKAEAVKLLAKEMDNTVVTKDDFSACCEDYIKSKSNILSPSSVRGYRGIMRQISDSFMRRSIETITLPIVQVEINAYAQNHSPKSTKNYSGFIMGVLKFYGKTLPSPKLPQKERRTPYIPSEEEVHRIFAELKGTKYEVPIMLSAMGLRKSEITALTINDLKGDVLTINKAKVLNDKGQWIIKQTKTSESTRTIVIPKYLCDRIKEQGYIYEGYPEQIYKHLVATEKKLGIEHFSLHKMRHFFASYMHSLGYTDKQITEAGGWKDGSDVLRQVYQHAMDLESAKRDMAMNIGSLL